MHLTSLHHSQIALFAGVLIRYPHEKTVQYESRIKRLIELLETPLLRPSFISRLYLPSQKSYTPLCSFHKPLHASAVHSLFTLVSLEVGVRLNSLIVSGRDRNGYDTWDSSILNLRSLHGMWLAPDVMQKTFGTSLKLTSHTYCDWDYMTKWPYQADGCEACMLTRVSGDFDTMMDLRMVVKSRMFSKLVKRHGEPRLWTWVEAWLHCWKGWLVTSDMPGEIERRMDLNELRAQRLKDNRKLIMKENRRRKRGKSETESSRTKRRIITEKRRKKDYEYLTPEEHVEKSKRRHETKLSEGKTSASSGSRADPAIAGEWASAPPYFGLPPMPSYDEAEKEHEAEMEVEEAVHDAEHEAIDSYLALISTPFLPGMGLEQHAKAETVLSESFVERDNSNEHRQRHRSTQHDDSHKMNHPYVHRNPIANYSASVYSTDDPSHPEYVPPRSGWVKTKKPEYGTTSRFSQAGRLDTASTVSSWIDASVPPSTLSLNLTSKQPNADELRRKLQRSRPHTIDEEDEGKSTSVRRSKTTTSASRRDSMKRKSDHIRRRRNSDMMDISPLSGEFQHSISPVSPQISPRTVRYHEREKAKRRLEGYPTPEPESQSSSRYRRHEELSRLSRPMGGPVPDYVDLSPSIKSTRISHSNRHHHHHHHHQHSRPISPPSDRTTHTHAPLRSKSHRDPYHYHHGHSHSHDHHDRDHNHSSSKHIRPASVATAQTTWSGMLRNWDPSMGPMLEEDKRIERENRRAEVERMRAKDERRRLKESEREGKGLFGR